MYFASALAEERASLQPSQHNNEIFQALFSPLWEECVALDRSLWCVQLHHKKHSLQRSLQTILDNQIFLPPFLTISAYVLRGFDMSTEMHALAKRILFLKRDLWSSLMNLPMLFISTKLATD